MPTIQRFNSQRAPVTIILLGIMFVLEIFFNLRPEARNVFYNQWMGIEWQMWTGQLWRPFTSCIGHANLVHMALNGWWLLYFGPVIEEHFGSLRTLGLIVLLAYVSILPEFIIDGYVHEKVAGMLGFSGVIYGMFGLVLIGQHYLPSWCTICDKRTFQLFVSWFFLCIFLTWTKSMPVANIAHGAGFVFGVLYGLAIFEKTHQSFWIVLAVVLSLLVLLPMVACPGHVEYEYARQLG